MKSNNLKFTVSNSRMFMMSDKVKVVGTDFVGKITAIFTSLNKPTKYLICFESGGETWLFKNQLIKLSDNTETVTFRSNGDFTTYTKLDIK